MLRKKIDWDNAIISSGSDYDVVEVPLEVKDGIGVSESSNTIYHRLLFRKSKKSDVWDNYYLYILPSLEDSEKFNNLDSKFNYYGISDDFKGKIVILNKNNELIDRLKFKINTATNREDENCLWIGWWYQDGHF